MNGVGPYGRTASACGSALLTFVLASACAHGGTPASTPLPGQAAEVARLSALLAQREQTIQQLEGRMAMVESSERQLREQLESARAPLQPAEPPRETVRIGRSRDKPSLSVLSLDAGPEPSAKPSEPRVMLTSSSELRPMLRLHAEGREPDRRELTSSSWTPPTTSASDRLPVMELPRLSALHARAPTSLEVSAAAFAPRAQPAPSAASAYVPSGQPELSAPAPAAARGGADELYVHALDLLRRREFPEAMRELDAFSRGYPSDPRFARAQFWRGEILYAQRDFARALAAFEQSLLRDPSGDKAADTLLRIARCQQHLGAHERARATLNKLKTHFPDSEAARVAEQVKQEDT